jgi:hypothetical protein
MKRGKVIIFSPFLLITAFLVLSVALLLAPRVTLDNSGIILERKEFKHVHLEIVFERSGASGPIAHYTEHLAWLPNIGKGSRPEDRNTNAWTNDYAVGYWLSGPTQDLSEKLRQLAVVFDPIDLPREMAETERDILLREYDWWMASNPDAQAAEDMEAFLYDGNAIAASVIGTPDEIRALSYDDAKVLHAQTHRPERARLVVIGDVTDSQLRAAMTEAGFPDLDAARAEISPPEFSLSAPETKIFTYPEPEAAPRMIWRKVVALPDPVDFDLLETQAALARDILNTNLPGGLAGPLRFDAFIARSFEVSITPIDERHVEFFIWAEPDAGVSFAALQSAFEAALTNTAKGIPDATYARVRERFATYWPDWSDEEETGRWMTDYVLARVSVLREPKTEAQLRKLDERLQAPDIDALLASLAGPGRIAIAFIGKDQG